MFFKRKRHSQYKSIIAEVPNKQTEKTYEFLHVYFVDFLYGDVSIIKIFTSWWEVWSIFSSIL